MIADERWEANQGEYIFVVKHDPWEVIESQCVSANGNETGGILIGYYTDDRTTAVITEATAPPKDSRQGRSWFLRGVAGLKSLLVSRWRNFGQRTFYVGEWHFHPSIDVEPSDHDYKQMQEISYSLNYQCNEPIMLIIGQDTSGIRAVRAFVFPRGKKPYEYQRLFTTK
jgi:integrative and conjugative element protein (TIGR02256 family)